MSIRLIYKYVITLILSNIWQCRANDDKYFEFKVDGVEKNQIANQSVSLAILREAKNKPIPEQFTICGSIYVDSFLSEQFFFVIFKDDGTPWLTVFLQKQILDTMTYGGLFFLNGMVQIFIYNHAKIL